MDPILHKILIDLEYKIDLDITSYFTFTEDEKQQLALRIIEHFIPYIKANPRGLLNLKRGLQQMNIEAVRYEDYEQADIFKRCLTELKDLTFLY